MLTEGMGLEAVSAARQTVMRLLKVILKEAFFWHSAHCMSYVNIVVKLVMI
jgi:hypothetical protein